MTEVRLRVAGYPPAKNEALSMLGSGHSHARRVIALLEAARAAIEGTDFVPFDGSIGLDVVVHITPGKDPWDATNYLAASATCLKRSRGVEHSNIWGRSQASRSIRTIVRSGRSISARSPLRRRPTKFGSTSCDVPPGCAGATSEAASWPEQGGFHLTEGAFETRVGRPARPSADEGEPLPDSADQPAPEESEYAGIQLTWSGAKQARISLPKPRILATDEALSDRTNEDPGNLVIDGDCRQALASLVSTYQGSVDVVLIDPPYNGGKKDLRYSDSRFHDPDADGSDAYWVAEQDGGRHTKWLNEMYPAIRLLRELMAPHGVIFVHLDDVELPRLLLMMEDIFGERNRIGMIAWHGATDNNPSRIVIEHEYVVAFARDITSVSKVWTSPASETQDLMLAEFARLRGEISDDKRLGTAWRAFLREHREELGEFTHYNRFDEGGPYTGMRSLHNPGRDGYQYQVIHPNGKPAVRPLRWWRYPESTMDSLRAEGRILFAKDETQIPQLKVYLSEAKVQLKSVVKVDSRSAAKELARLFPESPDLFPNAKPVAIEEYLLSFVAPKGALILDAFGGSGTTGHAVMRLNARDDGDRRFILIQQTETGRQPGDDGYDAALTADRLRRARVSEGVRGGFTFKRVTEQIDFENFFSMKRRQIVDAILQSDTSGRGGGIVPIEGTLVIGRNARREAICLVFEEAGDSALTPALLGEMYAEAEALGLSSPLRVYARRTEVFDPDNFRFFKLPDELYRNLMVTIGGRG